MLTIYDLMRILLDPSSTEEDKKSLIPYFSRQFLANAINLNAQNPGINFYIKIPLLIADDVEIIRYDILSSNLRFYTPVYQKFKLLKIGDQIKDSVELINPYSNPYCNDISLVENLWKVEVDYLGYVYAPVINNSLDQQIAIKFSQAHLYSFAGHKNNEYIDAFTPPNLRLGRRTLLLYAAVKQYSELAEEVANLFAPECRDVIKSDIYCSTAYYVLIMTVNALLEWSMQETQYFVGDISKLLQDIKYSLELCKVVLQNCVNYFRQSKTWSSEQEKEHAKNIAKQAYLALLDMHNKYQMACLWFRDPELTMDNKPIFPRFNSLGVSGDMWLVIVQIENLKIDLKYAIENSYIRDQLLQALNNNPAEAEILNDVQLIVVYERLLQYLQIEANIDIFLNLPIGLNKSSLDTESRIIYLREHIGRSIVISRNIDEILLFLAPNRKNSHGDKVLPKFMGCEAKVTMQFDITPGHYNCLHKPKASIMIASKELKILTKRINFSRKMGGNVEVSNCYYHYKKNCMAVRLSEAWAQCNLFDFIDCMQSGDVRYFMADKYYAQAINYNELQAASRIRQKIIVKLIIDLISEMVKLHDEVKAVHNDVKPDNILVYLDDNQNIYAKLSDFGLSQYISIIERGQFQPIATCGYASPQVFGFTMYTKKKLVFRAALQYFTELNRDGKFKYACFGRELLYNRWGKMTEDEKLAYENMQPSTKDDMFSLGVTLFMLVTGHYPTISKSNTGLAIGSINYMSVNHAYRKFKKYAKLFEGLFQVERDKRFTASQALDEFNRLPKVTLARQ